MLAKNSVAHRITYTSKFTFNHASFELVHATLVLHNQTINFFCIYRPPPSRKNKLSFTLFLEEFPNLLDFSNSITGKTIILGDFNLHFDQPNSPDVSKILESIQMFDLMQTVDKPTHRCGHILDWILHRRNSPNNTCFSSTYIRPLHYRMRLGFVCTKPTNVHLQKKTFFNRQLYINARYKTMSSLHSDFYSRTTRLCFTFIIGQPCSYEQL